MRGVLGLGDSSARRILGGSLDCGAGRFGTPYFTMTPSVLERIHGSFIAVQRQNNIKGP